jgi:hypothetical protein
VFSVFRKPPGVVHRAQAAMCVVWRAGEGREAAALPSATSKAKFTRRRGHGARFRDSPGVARGAGQQRGPPSLAEPHALDRPRKCDYNPGEAAGWRAAASQRAPLERARDGRAAEALPIFSFSPSLSPLSANQTHRHPGRPGRSRCRGRRAGSSAWRGWEEGQKGERGGDREKKNVEREESKLSPPTPASSLHASQRRFPLRLPPTHDRARTHAPSAS